MISFQTTGQLRTFLSECLVLVKNGQMKADEARTIVKIAGQTNESIYSEIKAARVIKEIGSDLGGLKFGEQKK